jgi:uncharacterized protein
VIVFWLTLASILSWFISTLAGGGSPLILIPVTGFFLGAGAVPPVVTIAMLIGNTQRVFLYWKEMNWLITWWYLPGSTIGAGLGAFFFTRIQSQWLMILLAIFLILSTFSYGLKENTQSFQVRAWYFLPAGFIYGFLSGLLGSPGPLLNSLYLNYGLRKEQMVATKSAHMMVAHFIKVIIYASLGVLSLPYIVYGLVLGVSALPGNWIGQIVLKRISEEQFRHIVVGFVTLSGILILWEQRDVFPFW